MEKLFAKFLTALKNIKNTRQLIGFLVLSLVLLVIVLWLGKSEGGYSLGVVLLGFLLVFLVSLLSIVIFVSEEYFEYLKSRDWTKSTHDYLKSQDPTKSPAYVASSTLRYNEGKKDAYKLCLEEIEKLQQSHGKINELKFRIEGALRSINSI